jgi:hypothetical protein
MEEKVFKTMGRTGAWNIAIGVVLIVVGLASGVLSIINGAKLIKEKAGIMF